MDEFHVSMISHPHGSDAEVLTIDENGERYAATVDSVGQMPTEVVISDDDKILFIRHWMVKKLPCSPDDFVRIYKIRERRLRPVVTLPFAHELFSLETEAQNGFYKEDGQYDEDQITTIEERMRRDKRVTVKHAYVAHRSCTIHCMEYTPEKGASVYWLSYAVKPTE